MSRPAKHTSPRRTKQPVPPPDFRDSANSDDTAKASDATFVEPDRRHAMISDAAYYRAERRDFIPGHEMEDWLAAEREVDGLLGASTGCGT